MFKALFLASGKDSEALYPPPVSDVRVLSHEWRKLLAGIKIIFQAAYK